MKRLFQILSAISAFCLTTEVSFADENSGAQSGTQIELRSSFPASSNTGPSRMPSKYPLALSIIYDASSGTFVFCDKNGDSVTYCIYNDDNECVMQGVCRFDEDGLYSAYLGALLHGTYYITVQINGIEYWGTFEIKEQ